jgi:hypothetical protein
VTLRTYDLPEYFGAAWGKIEAKSDQAFQRLIAHFFDFYVDQLLNQHWGEQISISPDNQFEISMVCQGLNGSQAKMTWALFYKWVSTFPEDYIITSELDAVEIKSRNWWKVDGNDSMIADKRAGAPAYHGWWKGDQDQVGAYLHGYDSLWMPASLLEKEHRKKMVQALFQSSRYKKVDLHFNKGLAGATSDHLKATLQTATNPAVCGAFALVIIADGERPAYPGLPHAQIDAAKASDDAHHIDQATQILRQLAPNSGSYVSESNYFNPHWQQEFWGGNYAKLQAVKKQYDPDGLFFVHHGVGSEEWSADGFVRVA